jgi:hypothetical protein
MHPIAKGLPVHAVEFGRFGARPPFQYHRQRQYTPNLRAIRTPAAQASLASVLAGPIARLRKLRSQTNRPRASQAASETTQKRQR